MIEKKPFFDTSKKNTRIFNRVRHISLGILILLLAIGCRSLSREFDFEKQDTFEAQFSTGMSQAEVEQKLEEISDYEFIDKWIFPNGDIRREYRTESIRWGSPTYYFRFTPDDKLVTLFPVNP
jgi:hypothetical protein